MIKQTLMFTVIAVTLSATAGATSVRPGPIDFMQLPTPVRQVVETQAPDVATAALSVARRTEGVYTIGYQHDGVRTELAVAADGTLQRIDETVSYRPRSPDPSNERIGAVISLTEDLADLAVAGDTNAVADKLATLRQMLSQLRPLLSETVYQSLGDDLALIESASNKQDMVTVALKAVDAFRLLENALDEKTLSVPREVGLLDYAGFKLKALTHTPTPDWSTIVTTAGEAETFWKRIEAQVQDKGLRDLMGNIDYGLSTAVQRKDIGQVQYAAQLTLDTVDLLEHHFDVAYKTGAGAITPSTDSSLK